jgi:hypothetical protein
MGRNVSFNEKFAMFTTLLKVTLRVFTVIIVVVTIGSKMLISTEVLHPSL